MFDTDEVRRVVDLQQKSYELLKWVNDALRTGTLSFSAIHEATTLAEAAADWLRRQRANLPPSLRPAESDLEPFAHLFVSYLTTSYQMKENPGTVLRSAHHGCFCYFCSYLAAANHLTVRTPDKKASARARELKDLYLSALAQELAIPLSPTEREALITHPTLAEAVTYATYGKELIRRSQFASQGEGILVLWREIAWEKGRLKKKFSLSADRILASEAALVAHLRPVATA
jgi:hypothetical protein